jgi:hypothetical protein
MKENSKAMYGISKVKVSQKNDRMNDKKEKNE